MLFSFVFRVFSCNNEGLQSGNQKNMYYTCVSNTDFHLKICVFIDLNICLYYMMKISLRMENGAT